MQLEFQPVIFQVYYWLCSFNPLNPPSHISRMHQHLLLKDEHITRCCHYSGTNNKNKKTKLMFWSDSWSLGLQITWFRERGSKGWHTHYILKVRNKSVTCCSSAIAFCNHTTESQSNRQWKKQYMVCPIL